MATTTYDVTGMTCGHCENHVREEIEKIAGVSGIEVSHTTGKLVITSDAELNDDRLAYTLATRAQTCIRIERVMLVRIELRALIQCVENQHSA